MYKECINISVYLWLCRVELARKGRSTGLEVCIIRDAGRTQIAPGSKTVLGVGPGKSFTLVLLQGRSFSGMRFKRPIPIPSLLHSVNAFPYKIWIA